MTEQPQQPPQPQKEAAFFTTIRQWGLTRGPNGVVGGVVEGLGVRVGMAPVPARLIVVIVWLLLPALVLVGYAAAWGLLPDRHGNIIIQNFGRGVTNVGALLGIAVLTLFGIGTLDGGPGFGLFAWGGNWMTWDTLGNAGGFRPLQIIVAFFMVLIPLAVLAGIVVLIVWLVKRSNNATPPGGPGSGGWAAMPGGPGGPAAPAGPTTPTTPDAGGASTGSGTGGSSPAQSDATVKDAPGTQETPASADERARASAGTPTAVHMPQPWEPALMPGDPRVANVAGSTTPVSSVPPVPPAAAPYAGAPHAPVPPVQPLRPVHPLSPVPPVPYSPPRASVPGPGKGGYFAFLGVLLVSAAIVIFVERADRLAVHPVLAWGAVATVGLGVVLIAVALTGRKLGFLGFLSVLAVLAGVPLAANAYDIRSTQGEDWFWWDIDVTVSERADEDWAAEEPGPVISATPAGPPFDATAAFTEDYAVAGVVPGCYSIAASGGPTEPHELGDVQTAIRLDELSADETIELSEGVTRLTIPEGTSVEVHGTLDLTMLWPQRDLYCDFWTDGAETWFHVLSNPGDPLLTVISEEGAALYIEEEQS